ncbi:I78 family peptidase inhibitor [Sphingosinithalassobacter portus]|uniref:I78 family peptidase inhibitor n=1 Tax=Stakelama portus TaxID=2676234 RepID=UPI000D6DE5DE|nr:I78 family peptidase inhibitor [Sphingosinithalassobacter portus]
MKRMVLIAPLMLGACTPDLPPEPAPPPADGGLCQAGPAQSLVGKPYNGGTARDAQRLSGARTLRPIPPDTMVTMDFRGDRVNVYTDENGTITKITCG